MAKAVIGPVLADVLAVSTKGRFTLATAFYSEARLDATSIAAPRADILVRLDLNAIEDWVSRRIAPDALLRLWKRHPQVDMRVFYDPGAHAKVYADDSAFLVGSANFTVRGLSGTANELLWLEADQSSVKRMHRALSRYGAIMKPLSCVQLEDFVEKNLPTVRKLRKKTKPSPENRLPRNVPRPTRAGSYESFLDWLERAGTPAAKEVLARAKGKGQLSGHIKRNFYGIRQFLYGHPREWKALRSVDPDAYRLLPDMSMAQAMRRFVLTEAIDEGGLVLDTWRTYLPERAGGKPKSGGGTSGNLNRMLPLMAVYLHRARK